MHLETYYGVYLGLCAGVIVWLGWTFHRSGSVVLRDAFQSAAVAQAITRLLDIGFYLVSVGYVAVTYCTFWHEIDSYPAAFESAVSKVGGFLLLLGFAHVVNLLVLALFRRRGAAANGAAGA
jgi:hypothetical protein